MLVLIRHAQAQADSPSGDHGRALSDHGRQQLSALRRWAVDGLSGRASGNLRLLVSDARRAQETAAPIAEALALAGETEPRIYEASLASLLALLDEHIGVQTLVLVGHNPGLSELASHLTGQRIGLPVAGAVALDSDHHLIDRYQPS